jgi:hypothetical protein
MSILKRCASFLLLCVKRIRGKKWQRIASRTSVRCLLVASTSQFHKTGSRKASICISFRHFAIRDWIRLLPLSHSKHKSLPWFDTSRPGNTNLYCNLRRDTHFLQCRTHGWDFVVAGWWRWKSLHSLAAQQAAFRPDSWQRKNRHFDWENFPNVEHYWSKSTAAKVCESGLYRCRTHRVHEASRKQW